MLVSNAGRMALEKATNTSESKLLLVQKTSPTITQNARRIEDFVLFISFVSSDIVSEGIPSPELSKKDMWGESAVESRASATSFVSFATS